MCWKNVQHLQKRKLFSLKPTQFEDKLYGNVGNLILIAAFFKYMYIQVSI